MKHKISIISIGLLLLGFVFSSQSVFMQESQAVTREPVKSKPEKITEEQIAQIQEMVVRGLRRSGLDRETAGYIIRRGNQILKKRDSKMLNKLSEYGLRRLVNLLETQTKEFMDFIEDYLEDYCYSLVERHWFVLEIEHEKTIEELIQSRINLADSRITTANFPNPEPGPSKAGYILVEFEKVERSENRPVTCDEAKDILENEGYVLANLRELIAFTKCGLVSPYPVVALGCNKQSRDHVLVLHSYCSNSGTIKHFLQLAGISRRFEPSAYFLVRVPTKHPGVGKK